MAGHGVRVDQEDGAAHRDERGREVDGDGRLAHAALRVEDAQHLAPPRPAVGGQGARLDHRAAAVIDGHLADQHRLDPPAERLRRVGPGEVLVVCPGAPRRAGEPIERPRRHDHQGRDVAPRHVEELVVLQRLVEVALAVEDRDAHVMSARQERFEVGRAPDRNRVEVGFAQHVNDVLALVVGQCDRDRGTCHGFGSLRVWEDSAQSSGSRALTVTTPSSPPVILAWNPGRVGITSRSETSGSCWTRNRNSPSGPEETPTWRMPG